MDPYIRNEYQRLSNKEYKFSLIDEVKRLKEACIKEENYEYFYLCDALIVDIYIEHQNLDEALKILSADLNKIDKVVYKNVYLSLLDRILYVYITNKNYKLAYKYAKEKYQVLDKDDIDAINRWNLEMSYIYAYLNDFVKAELALKDILKNPSEDLLPYVYSNLAKIYVDQKKGFLAEEALNLCIKYTNDEEGKVYNDYLLARILLLKDQKREAYQIFKQIFDNEDMNQMTLPIVNEYLHLLLDLNRIDEMGLVISKIAIFINACDDYYIKREFIKNKIKYLVASKNVDNLSKIIEEYEEIDAKIDDFEKKNLIESKDVEANDELINQISSVIQKVDKLTNIIANNVLDNSLRDVLMNYNNSLSTVLDYDCATFVLFNRTSSLDYMQDDSILCMNYKNNRLYEKKISFNALKSTIGELIIERNRQMAFDFNKSKVELLNIFNNRSYKDEGLNYVNAIPMTYHKDLFACMIYASNKSDITTENNTVLFRVATKILESSLTSVFLNENLEATTKSLNDIVDKDNLGLVYVSNDIMYLSKALMDQLHINHKSISRINYLKMINKADIDRYNTVADLAKNYSIEYKINLDDRVVTVVEEMMPYFDKTDKLLFSYGTISIKNEDMRSLIDGTSQLEKYIQELKIKANRIEFRYSIIRIRTNVSNYTYIKNLFGVEPFFIDNTDFLVVLENEVNLHTLEKLTSKIDAKFSVVRYPRDIVNIEESFNLSKVCIENNYVFFTEEVYKTYLKKKSMNKIAAKYLDSNLNIKMREYHSYDNIPIFEASLACGNNDDIRSYLDNENLSNYDLKLYRNILDKNINAPCFFRIQNKIIKKILDNNAIPNDGFNELKFLIYEKDNLKEIIERLSKTGIKLIIDANLVDLISAYTFDSKIISGIYLSKGIDEKLRADCIHLASIFNLVVYSTNKILDYNKNVYQTDKVHEIK